MKFKLCNFNEVKEMYESFYQELLDGFDDYYDGEIMKSKFYQITEEDKILGVCSIFENTLTSLYVKESYKYLYGKIFDEVIHFDFVNSIVMSSNDNQLMNEVLVRKFQYDTFAMNYKYVNAQKTDIEMSLASMLDLEEIKSSFKDFLENYEELIENNALYLYKANNQIASMVNVHKMKIPKNSYSIGVIVHENNQSNGIGTQSLIYVANLLYDNGGTVHSGHWIYNHKSRKMHDKAKFKKSNLLIKIERI